MNISQGAVLEVIEAVKVDIPISVSQNDGRTPKSEELKPGTMVEVLQTKLIPFVGGENITAKFSLKRLDTGEERLVTFQLAGWFSRKFRVVVGNEEMYMMMDVTLESNIEDGLIKDDAQIIHRRVCWDDVMDIHDIQAGRDVKVIVKDISIYNHRPIIQGERYVILGALSKSATSEQRDGRYYKSA